MKETEPVRIPKADDNEDLKARLERLRARMAAEGRKSAVDALDKAITRAARRRPRPAA